ncbi:GGDEF domain-containing protein [Kineobactrum salinum]|uniref:GGDEF domain-containing protein n=1 Tax=Kineobactrum salinum TaxID=2708301 RepID=A0A6C0U0B9_9GAMM|nr:GGDEF domain-containing protein [Kineobactrum salinum]QIB65029.1 GGDEF domain-containing protein [Kineobactrum salinum]
MNLLHMPTLFFAIAIACLVSTLVMAVIWRINRQMAGVLQWFQATLANTIGFLIVSPFFGLPYTPQYTAIVNTLGLWAIMLTLEGALRFRGFVTVRHWMPMYLLLPVFLLLSWYLRANEARHLFHDAVAAVLLGAAAVVMVWRTRERYERKVFGLAALFAGLLALAFAIRWLAFLVAGGSPGFDLEMARRLLFVSVFLYVMGWTFSITVACYFRAFQRALQIAQEDALTGLPNRRSIDETLRQTLLRARRHDEKFAVLIMDLNRFKAVNDSLGHQAGDTLLIEVARRLRQFVRKTDFAGRLGGDEFLIMVHGIADRSTGMRTLERLRDAVNGTLQLQQQDVAIDASAGIAIWPVDGDSVDALLSTADRNMYAEKSVDRPPSGRHPGA